MDACVFHVNHSNLAMFGDGHTHVPTYSHTLMYPHIHSHTSTIQYTHRLVAWSLLPHVSWQSRFTKWHFHLYIVLLVCLYTCLWVAGMLSGGDGGGDDVCD